MKFKSLSLFLIFFTSVFSTSGFALTPQTGKLTGLKGTAERIDLAGKTTKITLGASVYEGDYIKTGTASTVKILLNDKSELNLGPFSKMQIEKIDMSGKSPSAISMFTGSLRAKVQKAYSKNPKMIVRSGSTVMGIRGTDFQMVANANTGNTTLLTLEGQVAMTKVENSADPTINQAQAQALAKVAAVAEKNLEKQTPKVSPQMIADMDKAAKLAEAQVAPPMAQAQVKAIADTTAVITALVSPTMTDKEIKAFYEVAKAVEFKETLTPEQAKAVKEVKALVASAPEGQGAKVTIEQAQALAKVGQLAVSTLDPDDLSPAAKNALATADAAGAKVEPAAKLTQTQVEAIQDLQTVQAVQLTAEQALAIAQIEKIAPEIIKSDTLPPAQAKALEQALTVSDKLGDATENITPEQAQALTKIHELAAETKNAPAGLVIDLNIEQTSALIKTEQTVEKTVPADQMPAAVTLAMAQANKIKAAAPLIAAMSFEKIEAITEAKDLAKEVAVGGGVPVKINVEQANAMAETQKIALEVTKPANLMPAEKIAFVVNDKVTQVLVFKAASPAIPATLLVETLADPSKVVAVNEGQFSGVSSSQAAPSIPTVIAPAQFEAMKQAADIAGVTSGNTQANITSAEAKTLTAAVSVTTGKPLIPTVPPGLAPKAIMATAGEYKELYAISGVTFVENKATASMQPPAEGYYDKSSGFMAPTAGGYLDMNTGGYIAPTAGSTFDAVTGVYVAPVTMGSFNPDTGAYVPPVGFALDATKGLVKIEQYQQSQAVFTGGTYTMSGNGQYTMAPIVGNGIGFDPAAALATVPQGMKTSFDAGQVFGGSGANAKAMAQAATLAKGAQGSDTLHSLYQQAGYSAAFATAASAGADLAAQSGSSLFAGTAPTAYTGGSMAAVPLPPGSDPAAIALTMAATGSMTFVSSATNMYIPTSYVAPTAETVANAYGGTAGTAGTTGTTGTGMYYTTPTAVAGGGTPGAVAVSGYTAGSGSYEPFAGGGTMTFTDSGGLTSYNSTYSGGYGGAVYTVDANGGYTITPVGGSTDYSGSYVGGYSGVTYYTDMYTYQPLYPIYDPYACVYNNTCDPTYMPGYIPPNTSISSTSLVTISIN